MTSISLAVLAIATLMSVLLIAFGLVLNIGVDALFYRVPSILIKILSANAYARGEVDHRDYGVARRGDAA